MGTFQIHFIPSAFDHFGFAAGSQKHQQHGDALDEISREVIDKIARAKAKEASEATANRYLALIRAVLRPAAYEGSGSSGYHGCGSFRSGSGGCRYLTRDQEDALLSALPKHEADMAQFALATGLRQANVKGLEWGQVDMQRHVAWIHPDQAKGGKGICVPLNKVACQVIQRQLGVHPRFVFTYNGRPVKAKAWKKALGGSRDRRFPLARPSARVGQSSHPGRYVDGGTPGTRGLAVFGDGKALRSLRCRTLGEGCSADRAI